MSTKVATNIQTQTHTLHARAPFKVPRRPPKNDVTQTIQKFLPYVVVFLLSLMVYSSFKTPSSSSYPPYSPPNSLEEPAPSRLVQYLHEMLTKRMQGLEEIMARGDANTDVKNIGSWGAWRVKKAEELNSKLQAAKSQRGRKVEAALKELNKLNGPRDSMRVEMKQRPMTEKRAGGFAAYDSMHAWKQTVEAVKERTVSDVRDTVDNVMETSENVFMRDMNDTHFDSLSSFFNWVKSGLILDEQARMFTAMQEKWGKVDQETDMFVQQLRDFGDEVVRKLDGGNNRCTEMEKMGTCPK